MKRQMILQWNRRDRWFYNEIEETDDSTMKYEETDDSTVKYEETDENEQQNDDDDDDG